MSRTRLSALQYYLLLPIVLASMLILLIPVSPVRADSLVTFPDPNLEAAIRQAIGKPAGQLYQSELTSLNTLSAFSLGIVNLTGLQYCTGLTSLQLWDDHISDISPLSSLTGLTSLSLTKNQIADITPLSSLTSLTRLDIGGNLITDITPLSGLTSLTYLSLYGNLISNITPLAGLTNLTELYLQSNQILSDISPLAGLTNLIVLHLADNQITDLSALTGLTSLRVLYLGRNQISDIEPLSGLTSLDSLYLQDNLISDIGPLLNNPGMASGDSLYLWGNPLNTDSINTYIPALEARGVTVDRNAANLVPRRPSNVSPLNGATGITLTPTLQSSPFSDPNTGDTHTTSQWQLRTASATYSTPAYDSGTDASHLTSTIVPSLDHSTAYYWHVRYCDNHGAWSIWSSETSFTTGGPPNQPTNIEPTTATRSVALTPTLQSSPFADPDTGDTHAASQWQVREISASYSSPTYDSGTDNANLTIIAIPSGVLSHSTTYCWHVRYQDSAGWWSDWSAETFFTTTKGSVPFWFWIVLGAAATLVAGLIAYFVTSRRTAQQQTAQTLRDESPTQQPRHESFPPQNREPHQRGRPTWKTVFGWILFALGLSGLLMNIVYILVWGLLPITLVINSLVCILFIWGGWTLSHSSS